MNEEIYRRSIRGHGDYLQQWLESDTSDGIEERGTSAENENHQGFAARLYHLCLYALKYIQKEEHVKSSGSHRSVSFRECLVALYLWGDSFSTGELDKALDQSDDMKESVLEQLARIGKLVLRVSAIPVQLQELKTVIEQTKLILISMNDQHALLHEEFDDENNSGDESSAAGDCEIYDDISFAIACLTELRPSLEQNVACTKKALSQSALPPYVPFCLSDPAKIYVSLVRERYPQAQDHLVDRLGEANWQRHLSVRQKVDNDKVSAVEEEVGSVFHPYSTFHDSGIGTSVPAQTQYAPSHTSFLSSIAGDKESVRVPPLPAESGAGKPFRCFICGLLLSNISCRVDWKLHVFADLQPYICTFADCTLHTAQFPNRAAWADHEFSNHRIHHQWTCPQCPETFTDIMGWEQHLQKEHDRSFSGMKLQAASEMAHSVQSKPADGEECPLCQVVLGKPKRAFVRHVARHMEDIALMALPRDAVADSDEGSTDTDDIPYNTSNLTHHTSRGRGERGNMLRCPCGRASDGNMFRCGGDNCQSQWFHQDCVNEYGSSLNKQGLHWYCHNCLKGQEDAPQALKPKFSEGDFKVPHLQRCLNCDKLHDPQRKCVDSVNEISKDEHRRYLCAYCDKSFLYAKHLTRHMLRHTGVRPYTCPLCEDTFSGSDMLKRHFAKCSLRRLDDAKNLSSSSATMNENSWTHAERLVIGSEGEPTNGFHTRSIIDDGKLSVLGDINQAGLITEYVKDGDGHTIPLRTDDIFSSLAGSEDEPHVYDIPSGDTSPNLPSISTIISSIHDFNSDLDYFNDWWHCHHCRYRNVGLTARCVDCRHKRCAHCLSSRPEPHLDHGKGPPVERNDLTDSDKYPPQLGSTLFSLNNSKGQTHHTSDSFADWLFEPDTVKDSMAIPDAAGGRSENRKTGGASEDYLESIEEHHSTGEGESLLSVNDRWPKNSSRSPVKSPEVNVGFASSSYELQIGASEFAYPTSPYKIDIRTERRIYANDVPTRKVSSVSPFSTFQPPPTNSSMTTFSEDDRINKQTYEQTDVPKANKGSDVAIDGGTTNSTEKHKCPYCDESFSRRSSLRYHLYVHFKGGPFVCDVCKDRFWRKYDLKRHVQQHVLKTETTVNSDVENTQPARHWVSRADAALIRDLNHPETRQDAIAASGDVNVDQDERAEQVEEQQKTESSIPTKPLPMSVRWSRLKKMRMQQEAARKSPTETKVAATPPPPEAERSAT